MKIKEDKDIWIENEEDIHNQFKSYFQSLFTSDGPKDTWEAISGIQKIFVKTLTGKTITLEVESSGRLNLNSALLLLPLVSASKPSFWKLPKALPTWELGTESSPSENRVGSDLVWYRQDLHDYPYHLPARQHLLLGGSGFDIVSDEGIGSTEYQSYDRGIGETRRMNG
ncbi:hypothetical protein ACFX13_033558 [Malus domestica]